MQKHKKTKVLLEALLLLEEFFSFHFNLDVVNIRH